jgi:hypothetical protein
MMAVRTMRCTQHPEDTGSISPTSLPLEEVEAVASCLQAFGHTFARAFNQALQGPARQSSSRPSSGTLCVANWAASPAAIKLPNSRCIRLTTASHPCERAAVGQRACHLCRGARRRGVRRSARATRRACWTGRSSARRLHPRLEHMWQGRAQSWRGVAQAVPALALLGASELLARMRAHRFLSSLSRRCRSSSAACAGRPVITSCGICRVPVQMWWGRAQSRCRCGGASPVPVQMWQRCGTLYGVRGACCTS